MKKLLIIGAGFLQSYVIKKARALGYYTLAVDADKNAVGFKYADEYSVIDIIDEQACYLYALENKIDGVLTAATDYGVLSMAYIAQKMGLPSIAYSAAKRVKNKFSVRKCLFACNADSIEPLFEISDIKEVDKIKSELKYPMMVKPCCGSGSRGIARVSNKNELPAACEEAMRQSCDDHAMLETFVEGKEYGVEAFVYNGSVIILGIMRKSMTAPPYYAELGHTMPSGLSTDAENKVKQCVTAAIEALDINFGSVNTDILITEHCDVHIVDIGARMGGNLIGSHIIYYGSGIDYMGGMIRAAMGDDANFEPQTVPRAVSSRILALSPGRIKHLPNFDEICIETLMVEHHMHVDDIINDYHTNIDGCGYAVAIGESTDEAEKAAEAAKKEIDNSIVRY